MEVADDDPGINPFIAHRSGLDVYRRALAAGLSDDDYLALVTEANTRVAAVDGHGFTVTPLIELNTSAAGDGGAPVLAKVETGNVGRSHKARHLFGLLLHLLIDELAPDGRRRAELAIASCGNAAVGAAIVARSAERALRVFVPPDASPAILARLTELGAEVVPCPRRPGQRGDPCLAGLEQALAGGAVPFTVQGPLCPNAIDGGRTLGLELAHQLAAADQTPTAIYIQVGGGALATAVMDGLARGGAGPLRLHPVQAEAAHPYVAGWRRLAARLGAEHGLDVGPAPDDETLSRLVAEAVRDVEVGPRLDDLAAEMTPWPGQPRSVASGILDDETYDWRTVMAHQIGSGGWPVLVPEALFIEARTIAGRQVSPAPDETGAAGLAGLLAARAADEARRDEPAVVLLTGAPQG